MTVIFMKKLSFTFSFFHFSGTERIQESQPLAKIDQNKT